MPIVYPGLPVVGIVDCISDVDVADVDVAGTALSIVNIRTVSIADIGTIVSDPRAILLIHIRAAIVSSWPRVARYGGVRTWPAARSIP
jgi:hypothetical protein